MKFSKYISQQTLFSSADNGDGEIRTLDPLLARQVLSQLSYTPTDAGLPFFKAIPIFYLMDICPVGLSGLEPPTSRLSGVRSNRLSYKPSVVSDARKFLSGWRRRDSNSRPPACKAGALPTELRPRLKLAATCSPTPSPVQYHRPLRS